MTDKKKKHRRKSKTVTVSFRPHDLAWDAIHANDHLTRQSAIFALVNFFPQLRQFFWWVA